VKEDTMTATATYEDLLAADAIRSHVGQPIDVWGLANRSTHPDIRAALASHARREALVAQVKELEELASGSPADLVAQVTAGLDNADLLTHAAARIDEARAATLAASIVRAAIAQIQPVCTRDLEALLETHERPFLESLVADWRNDIPAAVDAFRLLTPGHKRSLALRNVDQWPQRPSTVEGGFGIPGAVDLLDCLFANPPRTTR
jgi:hypothetical protein